MDVELMFSDRELPVKFRYVHSRSPTQLYWMQCIRLTPHTHNLEISPSKTIPENDPVRSKVVLKGNQFITDVTFSIPKL